MLTSFISMIIIHRPYQVSGLQLNKQMECVYLHAPHVCSNNNNVNPGLQVFSDGPFYNWADNSKSLETQEDQWQESLEYIAKYCNENGPFDGIYGFSQGAAIVTNFSHPKIWRDAFNMKECPWKFAICACAAAPHHITISKSDQPISIPSFHIFGNKDRHLVNSKMISQYWNQSQMITHTHNRGHEIDMQMHTREKEMIVKLNDFLEEHCCPSDEGMFDSIRKSLAKIPTPQFMLGGYEFGSSTSK